MWFFGLWVDESAMPASLISDGPAVSDFYLDGLDKLAIVLSIRKIFRSNCAFIFVR